MTTVVAEESFAPPGPGSWFLDPTHWTRPVTRFHAEIFPAAFKRGFGESLRRYGSLLEYLEFAFVNGFPYYRPQPVGAPEGVAEHPPKEIWDELAQTHPEIRSRLATSAIVFERKLWREDLERWDRDVKPGTVREHLELLAVDPAGLGTDDLLAYIDRCRENQIRAAYVHHLFNVPALLPVGDFVVHAHEWTVRSRAELLRLLQGANPDPLGADAELEGLVAALRRDPAGAGLLSTPTDPARGVTPRACPWSARASSSSPATSCSATTTASWSCRDGSRPRSSTPPAATSRERTPGVPSSASSTSRSA